MTQANVPHTASRRRRASFAARLSSVLSDATLVSLLYDRERCGIGTEGMIELANGPSAC
jgi:hypothetical protein